MTVNQRYDKLNILSDCGPAVWYRAFDRSGEHPVLLQIIPDHPAIGSEGSERFLQFIQLLKDNPHPHIVNPIDTHRHEDEIWITYQWVDGISLRTKMAEGISLNTVQPLVQIVQEAVEHLSSLGVAHGNLSPDTIVIDRDDQVTLINIANYLPHRTSSFSDLAGVGYCSPEVFAGQTPTLQSDLFSLGKILMHLLTGSLVWYDENGEPRTKDPDDSISRLPSSLVLLQPFIENLLEYEPNDRNFDREEFALQFTELLQQSNRVLNQVFRTTSIGLSELQQIVPSFEPSTTTELTENSLWRNRRVAFISMAVLSVFVISLSWLAYSQRYELQVFLSEIGIGEHPELATLWRDATAIRADPQQSLSAIVAAFNRVFEVNPDHQGAHAAIKEVRQLWKSQISTAIDANLLLRAQGRLNEYVTVYPDDTDIQILVQSIEHRRRVGRLLDDTRALTQGGVDDPLSAERAIQAYQEVLRRDPANDEAQGQLDQLVFRLNEDVRTALQQQDLSLATALLEVVEKADPRSNEIDRARDEINRIQSLQEEISKTLLLANQYHADGQLIEPQEENAAFFYRKVQTLDPDNTEANFALEQIETQILVNHGELLNDRNFDLAITLERVAGRAMLSNATLEDMVQNREELLSQIEQANSLYREAQKRFAEGYLTQPSSHNAIELLTQARTLDSKNSKVNELILRCANRLAQVAVEAFQAGMEVAALYYLERAIELDPEQTVWLDYQSQWFPDGQRPKE